MSPASAKDRDKDRLKDKDLEKDKDVAAAPKSRPRSSHHGGRYRRGSGRRNINTTAAPTARSDNGAPELSVAASSSRAATSGDPTAPTHPHPGTNDEIEIAPAAAAASAVTPPNGPRARSSTGGSPRLALNGTATPDNVAHTVVLVPSSPAAVANPPSPAPPTALELDTTPTPQPPPPQARPGSRPGSRSGSGSTTPKSAPRAHAGGGGGPRSRAGSREWLASRKHHHHHHHGPPTLTASRSLDALHFPTRSPRGAPRDDIAKSWIPPPRRAPPAAVAPASIPLPPPPPPPPPPPAAPPVVHSATQTPNLVTAPDGDVLPRDLPANVEAMLDAELWTLYDRLRPSAANLAARRAFVDKLQRIFDDEWPALRLVVYPFGSSVNHLCMCTSDLDVCLTPATDDPPSPLDDASTSGYASSSRHASSASSIDGSDTSAAVWAVNGAGAGFPPFATSSGHPPPPPPPPPPMPVSAMAPPRSHHSHFHPHAHFPHNSHHHGGGGHHHQGGHHGHQRRHYASRSYDCGRRPRDVPAYLAAANSGNPGDLMRAIAVLLKKHGFRDVDMTKANARVPVVRFTDPALHLSCDINVNNPLALHNTLYVAHYVHQASVVAPLLMLVKYWTQRRALNDAANGSLSNYCWTMLVLYWLQRADIVPVLPMRAVNPAYADWEDQRTDAPIPIPARDSMPIAAPPNVAHGTHVVDAHGKRRSLAAAFYGFFRYFAVEFDDTNTVVALRGSETVDWDAVRMMVADVDATTPPVVLPKAWKLWSASQLPARDYRPLCVEDPLNPMRNLANNAAHSTVRAIKHEVWRAAYLLATDPAYLECAVPAEVIRGEEEVEVAEVGEEVGEEGGDAEARSVVVKAAEMPYLARVCERSTFKVADYAYPGSAPATAVAGTPVGAGAVPTPPPPPTVLTPPPRPAPDASARPRPPRLPPATAPALATPPPPPPPPPARVPPAQTLVTALAAQPQPHAGTSGSAGNSGADLVSAAPTSPPAPTPVPPAYTHPTGNWYYSPTVAPAPSAAPARYADPPLTTNGAPPPPPRRSYDAALPKPRAGSSSSSNSAAAAALAAPPFIPAAHAPSYHHHGRAPGNAPRPFRRIPPNSVAYADAFLPPDVITEFAVAEYGGAGSAVGSAGSDGASSAGGEGTGEPVGADESAARPGGWQGQPVQYQHQQQHYQHPQHQQYQSYHTPYPHAHAHHSHPHGPHRQRRYSSANAAAAAAAAAAHRAPTGYYPSAPSSSSSNNTRSGIPPPLAPTASLPPAMLAYFSAVGWPAGTGGAPTSPTHGDAQSPMSPPTDTRRAPAPQPPQPQPQPQPPQTMYWAAPTSPPHARRQPPPGTGRAPPPPLPPPAAHASRGYGHMPYPAYPTLYAAYPPAHPSSSAVAMHQSHPQLMHQVHGPSHGGDTDLMGPTSPHAPPRPHAAAGGGPPPPPPPPRDRSAVPPPQVPVATAPRLSGRPSWSAEAGDLILPMPFRSPTTRSGSNVAPAPAPAAPNANAGTPHGATIAHAVQQLWYAFHMQRATEDAASAAPPAVGVAHGGPGATGQETRATGSGTASASGAGNSASPARSTASSSVASHAPPAAAPTTATAPVKSGKRNKGPRMSNGTSTAAASDSLASASTSTSATASDSLAYASTSASAAASTTASSSSRASSRRGSTASLVSALRDDGDTPTSTKPTRKAAKSDATVAWVGPVPGNVVAPPVRKSTPAPPAPEAADTKPRPGSGKRRGRGNGGGGGNASGSAPPPTAVVPPSPGPSWVTLPADNPKTGKRAVETDTASPSPTRSQSPAAGPGGVSWAQIVQLPPPPPPPAAPAAVSGSTTPAGPRTMSPVRDADAVAAAARAAKARDMDRDWRRPATTAVATASARSGTVTPPVVAGAASPPVAHWTP